MLQIRNNKILLLKNAKVFSPNKSFFIGDILIEEGKIKEISPKIEKKDIEIIDLQGNIVIPGLVDISTSIGLIESGVKVEAGDSFEKNKDSVTDYRTLDGINVEDEYFQKALKSGVTTIVINSGDLNALGAQSCAIKTSRKNLKDKIISSNIDIKAALGDEPKKSLSRMGVVNIVRRNLENTKEYLNKKENNKLKFEYYNTKYESLIPVIKKEIPLKITANRIQDILKAIEIKKEFNINIIINGCVEGYLAINELRENQIPVVLHSLIKDNSSIENRNRRDNTGNILSENGINIALSTNHPETNIELLLLSACLMAKNGMKDTDILRSITINPSKILGLENRIGSIEVGKDADLVVLNGNPFKSMTDILMVIVDGKVEFEKE